MKKVFLTIVVSLCFVVLAQAQVKIEKEKTQITQEVESKKQTTESLEEQSKKTDSLPAQTPTKASSSENPVSTEPEDKQREQEEAMPINDEAPE
ncbi:MAG: hypothetical protein V3U80_05170 [Flavobacteriaceae bacterium]